MPDMQESWDDNNVDRDTYKAMVNEAKREGRVAPKDSDYLQRYNFVHPKGIGA